MMIHRFPVVKFVRVMGQSNVKVVELPLSVKRVKRLLRMRKGVGQSLETQSRLCCKDTELNCELLVS
jgi:hypothetical protein